MSTRTQDEIFDPTGGSGINSLTAETGAPNVWEDDGAPLQIGANSFTAANATLVVGSLAKNTTADDGYNVSNCVILLEPNDSDNVNASDDAAVTNTRMRGNNSFTNTRIIKEGINTQTTSRTDDRIVLGNFTTTSGQFQAVGDSLILDNCSIIANDNRWPIAVLNIGFGSFTLRDTSFVGAVAGQFYQGFISQGTTWAGYGSNDGGSGGYSGTSYFARNIHQGIAAGNNTADTNITSRLPNDAANLYLEDDMSVSVANGVAMQFNPNSAALIVNPRTNGALIPISFHGASLSDTNRPAAYSIVGLLPVWYDSSDGETRITDVRMTYDYPSFELPENTNDLITTGHLTAIENTRTAANTVFDPVHASLRGHWVLTSKQSWGSNGAGQTAISPPVNPSYRAKSFTHAVETLTDTTLPTRTVTNALGNSETIFGSAGSGQDQFERLELGQAVSLAPYLNGRTNHSQAPVTAITNPAEFFATARRRWFEENSIGDAFNIVGSGGNTVTFNVPVTLSSLADATSAYSPTAASFAISPTLTVSGPVGHFHFASGITFGASTFEWNGGQLTITDGSDVRLPEDVNNCVIENAGAGALEPTSLDGCTVNSAAHFVATGTIVNNTFNEDVTLHSGTVIPDSRGNTFTGDLISEFSQDELYEQTFDTASGNNCRIVVADGQEIVRFDNNNFNNGGQFCILEIDHTAQPTATVDQFDGVPTDGHYIDVRDWENEGQLQIQTKTTTSDELLFIVMTPEQRQNQSIRWNAAAGSNPREQFPDNNIILENTTDAAIWITAVELGPTQTNIISPTSIQPGATYNQSFSRAVLTNGFAVSACGRFINDFRGEYTYNGVDLDHHVNFTVNQFASAGAVTNVLSTTHSGNTFRIQIPSSSDYSSATQANIDFLNVKSAAVSGGHYVSYIRFTERHEYGLEALLNEGISFYNDGTHIAGIEITVGSGVGNVPIKSAGYRDTQGGGTIALNGNVDEFRQAIVDPLQGTVVVAGISMNVDISVDAVPEDTIDRPLIESAVNASERLVNIENAAGWLVNPNTLPFAVGYNQENDYEDNL